MKKALILVVLIVAPIMAFAQGTVVFSNDETELVMQWTSFSDHTLVVVPAGGGSVQLIAAPTGTALASPLVSYDAHSSLSLNFSSLTAFLAANPGWSTVATTGIAIRSGLFDGGTVTIPNIAAGATADYFIIGWTGSSATLDAAIAAGSFIGMSALFTTATGNPQITPPTKATPLLDTFCGITLLPAWQCLGYFYEFTAQPSNQTVSVGATATFHVEAITCPEPYYQWYFDGVSIPGATYSILQIRNAQFTNAGTYWVVLSNQFWGWGVRTSASATLTVLETPIINHPPQSQTAYAGSTVDLWASAAGSAPLAYQWFFNGSAIPGADTTDLQLTSVSATQAGTYTLVVTNVAGAVASAPASLSVILLVERKMVPGLSLLGQPGSVLNLENVNTLGPAPALVTLDSVILTNIPQWYFDVSEPLPSQRFYRAWQTSGPSVTPTLSLHMVPAITLTGSIGHTMRVDAINQFGPIDAWFTLDTVTLTNTNQLYFDTSAWGQSPRLYRLLQVP